ncbi:NlpC/P60 family protein [Pseudonocardia sp. GCM10023141]|uniref:NlpC/P60 family protein n=1 Tax=Pseudonocardia sp. GCM10023141 TaxID=3252653 RepID=UPI003620289C
MTVLGVAPASAQPSSPPTPPSNAADAKTQLDQVQREAEQLTEQWHGAKDTLDARQAEAATLDAAIGPARAAADKAKADEEAYRQQTDAVAMSTYESGNLDQFNALLASGSPQDFLDQMSALEQISAEYKDALEKLLAIVDTTKRAQADADAAAARAKAAEDEAAKAEKDLSDRKRDAEIRIDQAEKLLDRLTPQQRRDRNGSGSSNDPGPFAGTGVGVAALNFAREELGKPYAWGGNGPNSFDCSGLTVWAFKKAGVTLPRMAADQATVGQPVSFDNLQVGDLVFYYTPIGHVGIYSGNGNFLDAPQTGDVVKIQPVSRSAFVAARRL